MNYFLQIAIAIDQLANVLLAGAPDETLSSRAHRMRTKGHSYWGWTANAIDRLFFWQTAHCRSSYESELQRRQLPSHYTQPAQAGFFTSGDADA